MKNPTLRGTFEIKLSSVGLTARKDAGMKDTAIIHESLDKLLAQLDPMARKRITFKDCEIVEGKESVLPF